MKLIFKTNVSTALAGPFLGQDSFTASAPTASNILSNFKLAALTSSKPGFRITNR